MSWLGESDGAVGRAPSLWLISASQLLVELYWLRTFAEIEWAHLASMVVSTAMLGIGAGSTAILLTESRWRRHARTVWIGLIASSAIASALTPLLVGRLPFEALFLAWRVEAWAWLVLRELLVALPLALNAAAITLAFRLRTRPARVYGVHLLGTAGGVFLAFVLMATATATALLATAVGLAMFAAVVVAGIPNRTRWIGVGFGLLLVLATFKTGQLPLAATKGLVAAHALPEVETIAKRPGVRGSWELLAAPSFHGIGGTSLHAPTTSAAMRALYRRGDPAGVVLEASGTGQLRHRIAWLPYALRPVASVLVLNEPLGLESQAARLAGATTIVAIVPDTRTRNALDGQLGAFAGLERVDFVEGPPRAALSREERFDLIVLPPQDSLSSATGGLGSSTEDYLLTTEAVDAALSRLSVGGQVAWQRWTQAPPRDLLKLSAMVVQALEDHGVKEPQRHMVLARQWDSWCLVASPFPYTAEELVRAQTFAAGRGFDLLLPPALRDKPRHVLPGPDAAALLDEVLAGQASDYPFHIAPARDAQPYFHHFLSLSHLGRYWRALRSGELPPGEWGDFFLMSALLSALLLGGLTIALPATLQTGARSIVRDAAGIAPLFVLLGLGYMCIEILFLQQSVRVLGDTTVAAAVVLGSFLLGSGLGSLWLSQRGEDSPWGARAALAASLAALLIGIALPTLFAWGERQSVGPRVLTVIAPAFFIAFALGMPLPTGLSQARPAGIPWLLALNGWASVLAPPIASLVAIYAGYLVLGILSAVLYGMAGMWLVVMRRRRLTVVT